jgi:hypothetical protein
MAEERKELITARDMLEAMTSRSMPHARPIGGMTLKKAALGRGGGGDEFHPTEVPERKVKISLDKTEQLPGTEEVWDYRFDPYLGDCSWSEKVDGVECRCLVTLTEVDNWMFGFTQQTYTPPPGIRLIITMGAKRKMENSKHSINFGHRFTSENVRVYIHRRSFRVELSKQYQEFATLGDGARKEGLSGIGFPTDWDEVPYDV